MIRLPLRRLFSTLVVVSLVFSASPAAADDTEPTITFFGGGFGHGIGMSQYGALGRAEAGDLYEEILAFYYDGTTIGSTSDFAAFDPVDDVNVHISTRSSVSVSQPILDGVPQAGWEVELAADGVPFATATSNVVASYSGGTWSAIVRDSADGTELCDASCEGAVLTFEVIADGTHVVLEDPISFDNIGNPTNGASGWFAGGKIELHPAAPNIGCGSGDQFCVIHGDLTFEEYLYGIAEIPVSWHEEAQKAQAVAARSYAASRIVARERQKPWDVLSTTADQYYAGQVKMLTEGCGNWCPAVESTAGEVAVYTHEDGDTVAETFYSASNGGYTAEPPDVWASGTTRSYLLANPDPFDGNEANPYAAREYTYTVADVSRWLNNYVDPITGDQLHVGNLRAIDIDAPPSGRVSFAPVTLVGSEKTAVLEDFYSGNTLREGPYGFRLYAALKAGCEGDAGCTPLRSTNFSVLEFISFTDVAFDDYFCVPVRWMAIEGLTTGVSPNLFGADQTNTRGQLATFLWRFAGEPNPAAPSGFDDVPEGAYFEDPVAWMKALGITTGTSATEFSPDDTVTRGEAATFLWRFAGEPSSAQQHEFTDVPESRYFTEAVRWMVEFGITTGTSPTTFAPDGPLKRAQIATFVWRLAGQPDAFADGIELPLAMRDLS
jgi:hypothetical protein